MNYTVYILYSKPLFPSLVSKKAHDVHTAYLVSYNYL